MAQHQNDTPDVEDNSFWLQVCTMVSATELGTDDPWISGNNEQIYRVDERRHEDGWIKLFLDGKLVVEFPEGQVFRVQAVDGPESGRAIEPSHCGLHVAHPEHWCPGTDASHNEGRYDLKLPTVSFP